MARADHNRIQRRADLQDEGQFVILALASALDNDGQIRSPTAATIRSPRGREARVS